MAAGDLCTLSDVRAAMETATADTGLDTLISSWITTASDLIRDETQRELAPATSSATRDFLVTGSYVSLAPYDLRTVTTMTMDPSGTAQVLVADTDYQLSPIGADKWAVYTGVRLASSAVATPNGFGTVKLRIAGAWGFASVPSTAKDACVMTVRSWLRRSYPDGYAIQDDARPVQTPLSGFALPFAAKSMLAPLRHL